MGKRSGIPYMAAKKGDMCLHLGTVKTGSPDTTIEGKPAARLCDNHECKAHVPPPMKGLGPGKIVTASNSVFINKFGAARKTDLCQCLMPGPPPPGAASPQTKAYSVRGSDHYEKLMAVEHELAAWDKVKDLKEADLGKVGKADDPLGVKDASPPPRRPPSEGSVKAKGKPGDNKAFKDQKPPQGAPTVKPGSGKAGSLAGKAPAGTQAADDGGSQQAGSAKDAPLAEQTARKKEDKRKKQSATIDLAASMDLSVGSRGRLFFAGIPMDMIQPRSCSVYVGGMQVPNLDALIKEREEQKKKSGGA